MIRLDDIDLETHDLCVKDVPLPNGMYVLTRADQPDGEGWRIVGMMTSDSATREGSGSDRIVQFVLVVFVRPRKTGYRT